MTNLDNITAEERDREQRITLGLGGTGDFLPNDHRCQRLVGNSLMRQRWPHFEITSSRKCYNAAQSTFLRSIPNALTFCAKISALLPVSKRMRLPLYSMNAENPQSFFSLEDLPKAS